MKSILEEIKNYWFLIAGVISIVVFFLKRFYAKKDESKRVQPRFYDNSIGYFNGIISKQVLVYDNDVVILKCRVCRRNLKVLTVFSKTLVKKDDSFIISVRPKAGYSNKNFRCYMRYQDVRGKKHRKSFKFIIPPTIKNILAHK